MSTEMGDITVSGRNVAEWMDRLDDLEKAVGKETKADKKDDAEDDRRLTVLKDAVVELRTAFSGLSERVVALEADRTRRDEEEKARAALIESIQPMEAISYDPEPGIREVLEKVLREKGLVGAEENSPAGDEPTGETPAEGPAAETVAETPAAVTTGTETPSDTKAAGPSGTGRKAAKEGK